MSWTKPWAPGLAQEACSACETRCVAVTLGDDGRCRNCVAHDRPVAELARPEALQLPLVMDGRPM